MQTPSGVLPKSKSPPTHTDLIDKFSLDAATGVRNLPSSPRRQDHDDSSPKKMEAEHEHPWLNQRRLHQ